MAKQPIPRANPIPAAQTAQPATVQAADPSAGVIETPAANPAELQSGEVTSIPFSALFGAPKPESANEAHRASAVSPEGSARAGENAAAANAANPASPAAEGTASLPADMDLGSAPAKPTGLLFTSNSGDPIERIHQYAQKDPAAVVNVTMSGAVYTVPAAVASKMAQDDAATRSLQSKHDLLTREHNNVLTRVAQGQPGLPQTTSRASALDPPASGASHIGGDPRATQTEQGSAAFIPDPTASAQLDALDRQFGGTGELKTAVSALVQSAVAHVRREMVMPLAQILADHQGKLGMVEPLGHDRADLEEITQIVTTADPSSPVSAFTPADILFHMRQWQNGMIGQPGGPQSKDEAYNHTGFKSAAFNYALNQLLLSQNGNFTITAPAVGGSATPVHPNARAQGPAGSGAQGGLEQTINDLKAEVARLSGRGTTLIPTAGSVTTGNQSQPPRPQFQLTPDPNTRLMQLLHGK